MNIESEQLISIIAQFNPWWRGKMIPDLPSWSRGAFSELMMWIETPPVHRAVLISGARQVGKTTLIMQAIQRLLDSGVSPGNILYVTFDHPICKLAGLDAVLKAWRELEVKKGSVEYLFLDEAQFVKGIGTWIKHRVDFDKSQRVIFTGSAAPLIQADQESGVGRWHDIQISSLSFYEYLQIKQIEQPELPAIVSLTDLTNLPAGDQHLLKSVGSELIGHFHEYLMRGGFPQTVLVDSIYQAQKLLREDIIDKVLKRDMTALFGVRRILELEQLFIYFCMHDGGMQDTTSISKNLGIAKRTVENYLSLFESTYLIHRLQPFGYGKDVLRGKNKIYLSDPAMASAVLMKGKKILDNPLDLSQSVETAVVGHLYSLSRSHQARLSYWRSPKEKEVDIVVEVEGVKMPVEVKYQSQSVKSRDLPGLIEFIRTKDQVDAGFVVTKSPDDFGKISSLFDENKFLIKVPAALFCYYLGKMEFKLR